ncbi:conserved hypothetical protein [Ktedonobacter racemifer DSM 44963]|uniref:Uncharacterized protein n=1 Tax=Ktedonobacter racemifer DSM 44963 TaxID=485913 RepID=D6U404_KTERA|nr:conserved hypothetical protein [Ktedonobacter racemifer DSM 44963]
MGVHMSHIYLFPKRFRNLALEIEEFIEKEEAEVISFHFNLFPLDFQPRLNYDRYSFFPEQLMDVI